MTFRISVEKRESYFYDLIIEADSIGEAQSLAYDHPDLTDHSKATDYDYETEIFRTKQIG